MQIQNFAKFRAPLLLACLTIYVGPIVWSALSLTFGEFRGDSGAGYFLTTLILYPENPVNMLQRVIIPVITVIGIVSIWSSRFPTGTLAVGLCVIGIGAAGYLWFAAQNPETSGNLWQNYSAHDIELSSEIFVPAANQYVLGVIESLILYILIFTGVKTVTKGSRQDDSVET